MVIVMVILRRTNRHHDGLVLPWAAWHWRMASPPSPPTLLLLPLLLPLQHRLELWPLPSPITLMPLPQPAADDTVRHTTHP